MPDANVHNSSPDNPDKSQTHFVRQLKARDEDCWREFYDQHRQEIFSRALSRGLNHSEAEEVVQETFLTLYKKIDTFIYDPKRGQLGGFVAQTANWRIEDEREKRLPDPAMDPPQEHDTSRTMLIHRVPDAQASLAGEALQGKESSQLGQALTEAVMRRIKKRTSEKQFRIYELHKLQDVPLEEVCRTLDAKPKDVYNATLRVSERIAQEIEKLRQEVSSGDSLGNTTILFHYLESDTIHMTRADVKANTDKA